MNKVERMLYKRKRTKNVLLKRMLSKSIRRYGLDIPSQVEIGENVRFVHSGLGTVIHQSTTIEDNVMIMQNVTIGRSDIWVDFGESTLEGIIIKNGAVICAGAKILCKEGTLVVGENTIVGANAVLTKSTGDNEIWAGIPARKIRDRDDI